MRKAAKVKYRQKHPAPCTICGTLIKCDMYRHVACRHLEFSQLWRCPVSWCTVWRGAPQDLMDHICEAHNVLGEIRKVSLEMLFPPWTVTRQVYTESLTSRHSGISNDVLLFSNVGLLVVHHYRVHKRGLPHAVFRGKYLAQMRTLLPLNTVLTTAGGPPDAACSALPCTADPPDVLCAAPRPSRCAISRRRPVWVMELPVRIAPRLTVQDTLAAAGAVVFDYLSPLMPVSMDVTDIDMSAIRSSALSAEAGVVPPECEQSFGGGGGGDLLSLICQELGVAPLVDPGTDLEDELPSPAASPVATGHGVAPLPAQAEVDIELAQMLADIVPCRRW